MDYADRKQKLQDDIVKLQKNIKDYREKINKMATRIANLQWAYSMIEEIEEQEDTES